MLKNQQKHKTKVIQGEKMKKDDRSELSDLENLRDKIRLETLKMLGHMGYGHLGGSMSIVELLAAVLYGKQMAIDPSNLNWIGRDRL